MALFEPVWLSTVLPPWNDSLEGGEEKGEGEREVRGDVGGEVGMGGRESKGEERGC